jgi:hypothetical protein
VKLHSSDILVFHRIYMQLHELASTFTIIHFCIHFRIIACSLPMLLVCSSLSLMNGLSLSTPHNSLPHPPTHPFSQGKYSHCLRTFYLYNCFGRWNWFRVMGDVCCHVQEYNKTLLIHHLGTTCYKLHFFLAFDV